MDLDDHLSGLGNEYPHPDHYYGSEPYPLPMTIHLCIIIFARRLKDIKNVMFFGNFFKKLTKFCYDVVILQGDLVF